MSSTDIRWHCVTRGPLERDAWRQHQLHDACAAG